MLQLQNIVTILQNIEKTHNIHSSTTQSSDQFKSILDEFFVFTIKLKI